MSYYKRTKLIPLLAASCLLVANKPHPLQLVWLRFLSLGGQANIYRSLIEVSENYFENFSEESIKALVLAMQETQCQSSKVIGTEHILLGVLLQRYGIGAKALLSLGVTVELLRETQLAGPTTPDSRDEMAFTVRAKRVLELARLEAKETGSGNVRTEHILLGLVREGRGVASATLEHLGIDLADIRPTVAKLLKKRK